MKKFIYTFLFLFAGTLVSASEIFISFQPKGNTETIDSIHATNLTKGQTVKLNSGESLLIAMATSSDLIKTSDSREGYLYPNPSNEYTTLNFNTAKNEKVYISIYDMAGKMLLGKTQSLTQGTHRFQLRFPNRGLYHVNVLTNGGQLNYKAVYLGRAQQVSEIKYLGSNQLTAVNTRLKSKHTEKSLDYSEGDVVHYTVYSGDNTTVISDTPTASKTIEVEFYGCKDLDNRSYKIVQIGNQWWMAENLAYDAGKGCWAYDNVESNIATYGRLYTWEVAIEACPSGWHLSSDDEWEQLAEYVSDQLGPYSKVGGDWYDVGKHLKATGTIEDGDGLWVKDDVGDEGTDDFGFSGLPGGYRYSSSGFYDFDDGIGDHGRWWSATECYSSSIAYRRDMDYDHTFFIRDTYNKEVGFSVRCVKDSEAPELTQKINGFIESAMNDVYLWYDKIPDIDIRYEFDSKAYFQKLLYSEDKWSFITEDVDALLDSFEGKEKSFGYSLAFGTFSNTGDYFAIVEFVYPNTPAYRAGLKRGDIIMELNNGAINDDNYRELLNGDNISVMLGVLGEQGISPGSTVSITSRELNLNPVLITDVIEHEGSKIGYLFYAQYISEYNSSLDTALQFFLDEQITDLVIDLRYNPGGVTTAAQHLCSSIAPLSTVNGKEALVIFQWNDKYQNYWITNNITDQLEIPFVDTTAVKMGLNKVYFLTGRGTASASELTIAGLEPYMNVTTIGESTYGKYTGSITVTPDFYYENEDYYIDFDNWGIQPIVVRFANSLGVTNFKDGFSPDIPVEDELFDAVPLGDKSESLLKAALEDITGTPVVAMKEAKVIDIPYTIFDRGFSKYDANKRELLIDNAEMEMLGK